MKLKILLSVLICFSFFSCKNEIDKNVINVSLQPILSSISDGGDTPMNIKSSDSTDVNMVYAIQIYENDIPYCYGLFNDISKMQIALTTGKKYNFKITAYKNGTGNELKTSTDSININYYLPEKIALKNHFYQGDLLKNIDDVSSIVLKGKQNIYPEIDVFYSTKTITLSEGTTTIDFNMLRMGFGAYFKVDALTSGSLEIYFGNDTIKLNSNTSTFTSVRQFSNSKYNFNSIYNKADSFSDTILVSAKWTSESGTVVNLKNNFIFQRNYQKTINIQLNTLTGNFSFETWKSIPKSGLVAWYPFNGNANDQSGNGYNGTVYNTSLTTDRFGNINNAYLFNGLTSYISTNCTKPSGASARTFNFWAQVNESPSNISDCRVIHYGGTTAGSAVCITLSDYFNLFRFDIGNSYKLYQYNYPNGVWHMYTIVLPANPTVSDALMYIDGKLLDDFTYHNPTSYTLNTTTDYPLVIGRATTYDDIRSTYHNYAGKLDDIAIWDRVLTPAEIVDVYNAR